MKPKVTAIIQARMRSNRLPGKIFLPLAGKPALWWIVKRASLAELVDEVIVATTSNASNDLIWIYGNQDKEQFPASVYRYTKDENNVIGRVLSAARKSKTDIIVDITGDCPMVDPQHIDYLINELLNNDYDYISNDVVKRSWPNGLDVQVYKTSVLRKCKEKFNPKQHCGWNIPQHPETFNCGNWPAPESMYWPDLGLTLDTARDYEFLSFIFDTFGYNLNFEVEDVVGLLKRNPKLITNKDVYRKKPKEG